MRTTRLAIIVIFLLVPVLEAWQGAKRTADEEAIRKILQDFVTAFNTADAKGFAALYAMDGDRMDSFGHFFKGRASIERSYVDLFAGPYKGGILTTEVTNLRFLTSDTAVVDLTSEIKGLQGGTSIRKLFATTVYVKRDGKWAIAAHRVWPQPNTTSGG